MEPLLIPKTQNTPLINCDNLNHEITIEGESRPEDIRTFYANVFNWVENYESVLYYQADLSDKIIDLKINFKLVYFNSSSLKVFIELLDKFNSIKIKNNKITFQVNWFYEKDDDDILEAGEEFVKMTGIPMNFISYE